MPLPTLQTNTPMLCVKTPVYSTISVYGACDNPPVLSTRTPGIISIFVYVYCIHCWTVYLASNLRIVAFFLCFDTSKMGVLTFQQHALDTVEVLGTLDAFQLPTHKYGKVSRVREGNEMNTTVEL